MGTVYAYSDGGCSPNPGLGGYGVIQRFTDNNGEVHERELYAGYTYSTNNRMELTGAIVALNTIACSCDVILTTDSEYVVKGFTEGRIEYWSTHNWKTKSKTRAKNRDLWEKLLEAKNRHKSVEFVWVKGHADNEYNERCDKLCDVARKQPAEALLTDPGDPYED